MPELYCEAQFITTFKEVTISQACWYKTVIPTTSEADSGRV